MGNLTKNPFKAGLFKLLVVFPSYVVAKVLAMVVNRFVKTIDMYREFSLAISIIPFFWGIYTRRYFYESTLLSVGKDTTFMFGCIIEGAECKIGNNVYIGPYTHIYNNINIGNDVMIGPKVSILDGKNNHGYEMTSTPMRLQKGYSKSVSIGNNVWIGINSCITESIADNCVIGACTLVLKPVQEFQMVVGNPSRVIKYLKEDRCEKN